MTSKFICENLFQVETIIKKLKNLYKRWKYGVSFSQIKIIL